MNLRIRYEKHPSRENWVISKQVFVSKSTGAKYRVLLDIENKQYFIRNERTKEFAVKGKKYGNFNVLKRNARAHLGRLGVPIGREVRDRTYGLVKKDDKENNPTQ